MTSTDRLAGAVCAVQGCGVAVHAQGWCRPHYLRWVLHGAPDSAIPVAAKALRTNSYAGVRDRLTATRGPAELHWCAVCGAAADVWAYVGGDPAERVDPYNGCRYGLDLAAYQPRCLSCHRLAPLARAPRPLPVGDVCDVAGCDEPAQARGWCHTHTARWRRRGDVCAGRPIERKTTGGVSYWSVRQRLKAERGPAASHGCADCPAPAVDWSYTGGDPQERVEPGRGYRYSLDLDRYRPRCRSCHRRATVAAAPPAKRRRVLFDVERAAWFYERGAGVPAIAKHLGVSRNAVYRELRAHGVSIRPRGTRPTVTNNPPALPDAPQAPQETDHS